MLYRLKDAGFKAYIVGGGVRDLLLGRRPKDFDIGTDAHPYQVKKLFRNCFIIGRRFRLAHIRVRHEGHRGRHLPAAGHRRRSRRKPQRRPRPRAGADGPGRRRTAARRRTITSSTATTRSARPRRTRSGATSR
ncbi:MAG: hypothetical protein MZV49_25760 [Rhodopseudomonas palustris]|nr:hypothetical protein [Rhodopseudomonas palustris]